MDKPDELRNDWEAAKLLLSEIKVEKQSIGTWMNTYHSSQSFLFAAFAISSFGQHMHHQAIHWFCNYLVPGIGILFSFFMSVALFEARARLSDLHTCLRNRLKQLSGTPTEGIGEDLCLPSASARWRGSLYSKWVPVICGIAWSYVGIHSVWYDFVNKQTPVHHSSSVGKAGADQGNHEEGD